MNVRVPLPSSPTNAGLVLAAERAAQLSPSETLGSWLKAQHSRPPRTSFVDQYGRLLSESSEDARPLECGADHVRAAWRASFDERMRELTTQAQAMVALSLSTRHAKTSLRTMLTLVRVASRLRRMTVFVDSTGQASGALTWLHISPRTQNRIQQSPASRDARRVRIDPPTSLRHTHSALQAASSTTPLHVDRWGSGRATSLRSWSCPRAGRGSRSLQCPGSRASERRRHATTTPDGRSMKLGVHACAPRPSPLPPPPSSAVPARSDRPRCR